MVVDDDIDIANPADVIWAIATRCHVREGLDVVKGSGPQFANPLYLRKSARPAAIRRTAF